MTFSNPSNNNSRAVAKIKKVLVKHTVRRGWGFTPLTGLSDLMSYYLTKKYTLNSISDDPVNHIGWYWNSLLECTESVFHPSFYIRTIIKTCLAHPEEHLPILNANVVGHICDYADKNVLFFLILYSVLLTGNQCMNLQWFLLSTICSKKIFNCKKKYKNIFTLQLISKTFYNL